MQRERWQQVEDAVQRALELKPGERAHFLDQVYSSDPHLYAEVESLLEYEKQAADFIEAPAYVLAAEVLADDGRGLVAGRRIGPYKVVREIGRGGMGAVFLAERADGQFHQQVALKIVRRSFADSDLARRFRQERQILASLNHPNIARLLDGGVSADGEPFLAMEYVEGVRIDDYCTEHDLSTEERLRLFLSVCRGVSYAHQHLVIHRDLKPSNILVTSEGVPKLLDFGIAKLLDAEQASEQTQTNLRAFTPEYAAPEQVRGQSVTTATDIYSLGVILYELLTGARPYKLKDASPEELSSVICDSEPAKPSEAVSRSWSGQTIGGVGPATGGEQKAGPPSGTRNPKALKGDIDNIVLMALRKEPARRYKSVEQFSEDIERHLKGLPVIARKDTFAYRATKFIGRNKVGVAAAALVLLTFVVGLIATAWQASVARAQRDRAQAAQAKAERISAFLATALSYSDPTAALPGNKNRRDATINQMLDDVAPRIETELADQPEARAALERTVGEAYAAQNRLDDAERYLRAALETQTEVYDEDNLETARTLISLASLQYLKGDVAIAEQTARRALAIHRRREQQTDTRNLVKTLAVLGNLVWERGEIEDAEAFYREALSLSAHLQGADRELVADANIGLGSVRWAQGRLDEAAVLFRAAVAEYRALPHLRWRLGSSLTELSNVLTHKKEFAEALGALREGEAILRETLGDVSFPLADNLYRQAYTLCLKGDYAEAEPILNKSEEMFRQNFPNIKMSFANLYDARGMILTRTGRAQEGEKYNRQALELYQSLMKRGANGITLSRMHLAESLAAQKKYEEAERVLLEAYKDSSEVRGKEHFRTKDVERQLAALYEAGKKLFEKPQRGEMQ